MKAKTLVLEEKDFVETVSKITAKDVVCSAQPTSSGQATYNGLFFTVDGVKCRIVLHLKTTRMAFRAAQSKNNDGTLSPFRLKASFEFNKENPVHLAIETLSKYSEEAGKQILGKTKIFSGCIQTTAKGANGIGEIDVEPRIWLNMPPKDRKTMMDCSACAFIVTINDGKQVKQDILQNIRVQNLVKKYGRSYMVNDCYISFDNFLTVGKEVRHPLSFYSFKPVSVVPLVKDNSQEIEEMKKQALEYIKAENIINNVTAEETESEPENTNAEENTNTEEVFDLDGGF
jgi:hypothetical protein